MGSALGRLVGFPGLGVGDWTGSGSGSAPDTVLLLVFFSSMTLLLGARPDPRVLPLPLAARAPTLEETTSASTITATRPKPQRATRQLSPSRGRCSAAEGRKTCDSSWSAPSVAPYAIFTLGAVQPRAGQTGLDCC